MPGSSTRSPVAAWPAPDTDRQRGSSRGHSKPQPSPGEDPSDVHRRRDGHPVRRPSEHGPAVADPRACDHRSPAPAVGQRRRTGGLPDDAAREEQAPLLGRPDLLSSLPPTPDAVRRQCHVPGNYRRSREPDRHLPKLQCPAIPKGQPRQTRRCGRPFARNASAGTRTHKRELSPLREL